MQDYLIVKGQIDPIENENAPETYTVNDSKVAGSANQNSDGPVNGSNSNLIEPNRNLYSDEVAASTPSVEKPSLEDQSRF